MIMMSMRMWIIGSAGVGLVAAGMMGCSTSSQPAAETDTAGPVPTTQAPADGGCSLADVSGTTKNTAMQELATDVYSSLDCTSDEPLQDQLKAAAESDATAQQAKAAGATAEVDTAAGGTVLKLFGSRSACQVTVLDNSDSKMLVCGDA